MDQKEMKKEVYIFEGIPHFCLFMLMGLVIRFIIELPYLSFLLSQLFGFYLRAHKELFERLKNSDWITAVPAFAFFLLSLFHLPTRKKKFQFFLGTFVSIFTILSALIFAETFSRTKVYFVLCFGIFLTT